VRWKREGGSSKDLPTLGGKTLTKDAESGKIGLPLVAAQKLEGERMVKRETSRKETFGREPWGVFYHREKKNLCMRKKRISRVCENREGTVKDRKVSRCKIPRAEGGEGRYFSKKLGYLDFKSDRTESAGCIQ